MKVDYHINILPDDISKGTPHKFDENGVIMSKIPYTQEYHYHTTTIASYILSNLDSKKVFYPQLKWLLENQDDDGLYWHDFTLPFYDFEKPWVGGLAQGLAISALIRTSYADEAKRAFYGLCKKCIMTDRDKNVWIAEYPKIPTILNGFIYALFGVYDIIPYTKKARILWDDCLRTLYNNLPKYDIGYWSRYDLETGIPSTEFYHKIHIDQMGVLSDLSQGHGDIFRLYNRKWQWQLNHVWSRLRAKIKRDRMIIKKHGAFGIYNCYKEKKRWLN